MWYVASFVRGMSVDEALKQLPMVGLKGATIVKDTILEAQQLAVENHNVEFKTNLWIGKNNNLFNLCQSCCFYVSVFNFNKLT